MKIEKHKRQKKKREKGKKRTKVTKTCVVKVKLKFQNYENCLEATQLENNKKLIQKMKFTQIVLFREYY